MRAEIKKEDILKWLERIRTELPKVKPVPKHEDFLVNINAYISDTDHFMLKGDYVLAFESVIWAWAWYEIGIEKGFLVKN